MLQIKQLKRKMRHRRVRAKVQGTAKRPRLCVFKSNKYIYVQLIDDEKGHTLLGINVQEVISNTSAKGEKKQKLTKSEASFELGKLLAQKAIKKKIKKVIFDRGGYKYHGRVKAVAEGARENGLEF